jgi:hypothetical protein
MDEDFVAVASTTEQLLLAITEQAKAIKSSSDSQNKLADAHTKLAETQSQLAKTQETISNTQNNLSNVYDKLITMAFDTFNKYMSPSPQTSILQLQTSVLETFLSTSRKLYSSDGVPINKENNWLAPENQYQAACHICTYYGHGVEQCPNITVNTSNLCIRCWQRGHQANDCSRSSSNALPPPYKPNFISRSNMLQKIYMAALACVPSPPSAVATTATATATTIAANQHN